jgi:hypothetical protein
LVTASETLLQIFGKSIMPEENHWEGVGNWKFVSSSKEIALFFLREACRLRTNLMSSYPLKHLTAEKKNIKLAAVPVR